MAFGEWLRLEPFQISLQHKLAAVCPSGQLGELGFHQRAESALPVVRHPGGERAAGIYSHASVKSNLSTSVALEATRSFQGVETLAPKGSVHVVGEGRDSGRWIPN